MSLAPHLTDSKLKTWKVAQTTWANACKQMLEFAREHSGLAEFDSQTHKHKALKLLADSFAIVTDFAQTPSGFTVTVEAYDNAVLVKSTLFWNKKAMFTLMYVP